MSASDRSVIYISQGICRVEVALSKFILLVRSDLVGHTWEAVNDGI